ncbi:Maf family protein [soil metagenome]
MKHIVLASGSPRRKEILQKTKLPFTIVVSEYVEDMTEDLPPKVLAEKLSRGKAEKVASQHPDAVVIAADTFVAFGDKLLGKPKSEKEAEEMLRMVSGKRLTVITGVTIMEKAQAKEISFSEETILEMKEMTDEEIFAYIKTGEPMDKAGAFGMQELGASFVKRVEGDFFSAVGLPLYRLMQELKDFGIHAFQQSPD